jgi:hypothetical protein
MMDKRNPKFKTCVGPCERTLVLEGDNFRRDSTTLTGFKNRCKQCEPKRGQSVTTVAPIESRALPSGRKYDPDLMSYIGKVVQGEAKQAKPVEETVTPVEEHRLKKKLQQLEAQNRQLVKDLSDAQELGDIVREAHEFEDVPGIEPREYTSGLREGTALAMASDWHIDEVIEPGQVSGRNRYNPDVSARRMERFFESVRWAIDSQRNTFTIRDLVLWLGGDLITNYLHPDNELTNAMSPPEALAYAHRSIADGIKYLLEDEGLERIVVPCNDGNHGRMSKKLGSSSRTMMSLEIMLYKMLQREFRNEPRIQFIIAEGEHVYYEVYGRTIRFVHGDAIKYAGGIGGITIPLMKAVNAWNTIRQADLTCLGHFHQRLVLPDIMVNGSLIGYSPFSMTIRARFEPPSQNFSILEPKRFRSIDLPLWVSERSDDQG